MGLREGYDGVTGGLCITQWTNITQKVMMFVQTTFRGLRICINDR